jgi:uncharacterized membrane protein (DUF4010 family)
MSAAAALPFLDFAQALAIGALIGIEREQKKRAGHLGTGGLRTCILLSELGALAAWLTQELGAPWVFAAAGLMVAAVVVAGYWLEVRAHPEALGMTTEITMLLVFLLGGAVVFGHGALAVALAIATSAVLAFKEPLHGLVGRIGRDDLQAGLKLLIATFIVLPVLPDRTVDPWDAINPYELCWLVILISALSLAGYLATRWLGPRRGLAATGFAGGLVSSTAVTLSFARRSAERVQPAPANALAAGILLAWLVMLVRVAIEVLVVQRALLATLVWPLGAMGLATLATAMVLGLRGARLGAGEGAPEVKVKNPFSLTVSIRFALFFALVLLVVALVRRRVSGQGLYLVAALAGLTDVDAITLSMADFARNGGEDEVAVGAIVTAVLANTLVKCAVVAVLGSRELARRLVLAGGLILASAVLAVLCT